VTVRHPKAQWVPAPVEGGAWADDDGQWKFCWHDTETPPGPGRAAALCRIHRNPPQLWADPYSFELVQGISLDRSGRSLKASSLGQTNRDLVIQCEILGYHYDMANLTRKQLEWLALVVYLPVLELGFPIAPNALQTYPTGYPNMANPSSPIRLPSHVMDNYSGQTCHEHWFGNCVTADTLVLTADLRWVPAGSLLPGDELVAFDEETPDATTTGRRFRPSVVEHNASFQSETIMVETLDGSVTTTPEHPWLVRLTKVTHGSRTAWVQSKDLDPAIHQLYFAAAPWVDDQSHAAGYAAGLLDADGHFSKPPARTLGFGQVHGEVLDWFVGYFEGRGCDVTTYDRNRTDGSHGGYEGKQKFTDVRINGGMWETLGLIASLRPRRLLTNAVSSWQGASVGKTTRRVPILSVRPGPASVMAGLQTSTRTYVAGGFLVHNSHTDAGGLRTDIIRDIAYGTPSPAPPPPDPEELTVADVTAILSEIAALRQEVTALQATVGQQATLIGGWMQGERKWMGEGAYRIDGKNAVHVLSYQLRDDGTTTPFLQHLDKNLFAMLQTGGDVDPWVQVITNPEQQAYFRSLPGFVDA
jgi:hypothetical protein